MSDPGTPEHNPAVLAARFMRVLVAEEAAVTQADVAARTAPPAGVTPPSSPGPVWVAPPAWRHAANCTGLAPELFYPERGGAQDERARQIEQAKAVCAGCSVRPQCLAAALEAREPFGIWGGMSETERRSLLRRLPRIERCGRCDRRYVKTSSGQRFCGAECPALVRPRSRRRAS
jgi:WhiB family redox-sensing transcriptional regulator